MITYSIEKLYHFSCSVCKNWWTISDYKSGELYCPRCGTCKKPKPKAEEKIEDTKVDEISEELSTFVEELGLNKQEKKL